MIFLVIFLIIVLVIFSSRISHNTVYNSNDPIFKQTIILNNKDKGKVHLELDDNAILSTELNTD